MHKRILIKNHQQEMHLIFKRLMISIFAIFLMVSVLIGRLAVLQIYKRDVYSTLSTQNWLDLVPIEPTRGLIYDRNGTMLAENISVFSLDVIPLQVNDMNKTLAGISKLIAFSDNDLGQFQRQLKQHRRFEEIPLKLRLSEDEVSRFTENQHRFPGVFIKARLMRHYPLGETFSHVLGYVGRINAQELNEIDPINYSASHYIGKDGIEKFYEEELHGKVGYEEVENDASNKPVRILKQIKGTSGKNIYLTLDSGLQLIAQKAMEGYRGAIVAIAPDSGQVLAMVSAPSFDPNAFVTGINQKDFQALQSSQNRPLFNRALRGLYPLASTIKPFLALQGLNLGITTTDYTIVDHGWFQLNENSIPYRDWKRIGHGKVDLNRAIASSCDIYFYELANKMGIRHMDNILTQFGFGAPTGIDLDDEVPGIVASPEWKLTAKGARWYDGDTIISGIGQGAMQSTPLQLAAASATLANRGQRFVPYLLLAEQLPGTPALPQQPIPLDPIKMREDKTWEIIVNAMQNVVTLPQGTAHKIFAETAYTLAAKTGTAQVVSLRSTRDEENKQTNLPERLRDHHLFIAFAPVDHPKIALAIVTENNNAVSEIAKTVLDYYLGKKENVNRQSQDAA